MSLPVLGFLGAGRMAGAMVRGILRQGPWTAAEVRCTCGDDETGAILAGATGITHFADAAECLEKADTWVLACKPQQLASLSPQLGELAAGKLIISILAGTPLSGLARRFPPARNIIRAMPNTPGQIGQGISAYASLKPLVAEDETTTEGVLGSLGPVLRLPEEQIDAVTAVSGSGPAYFFEFTVALAEAGEKLGLAPEVSRQLARATAVGSAALLEARPEATPDQLREEVTSPGGTTAAALQIFSEQGLRALVSAAATAAARRSAELSRVATPPAKSP